MNNDKKAALIKLAKDNQPHSWMPHHDLKIILKSRIVRCLEIQCYALKGGIASLRIHQYSYGRAEVLKKKYEELLNELETTG